MGFFDLLTPFFVWVDQLVLVNLPLLLRLFIWALLSAFIGVWVFAKLYNAEKLSEIKLQLKQCQKELIDCEGEFSELKALILKNIKLSIKRMNVTFWPALVSMMPVIFILAFLSNHYDLKSPEIGETVAYSINFEAGVDSDTQNWFWENESGSVRSSSLIWPAVGDKLFLTDGTTNVMTAPFEPVSIIHKQQWWNILIANPAGYITSQESEVEAVNFEFESLDTPEWMTQYFGGWFWCYMMMTVILSLLLMFILKVKF